MRQPDHRPISIDSVVVASHRQISAELGEEVVILGTEDSVYSGLDGVGAAIWRWIQEPTVVSALQRRIVEAYEVDTGQAQSDLLDLLGAMAQRGLIEVRLEADR